MIKEYSTTYYLLAFSLFLLALFGAYASVFYFDYIGLIIYTYVLYNSIAIPRKLGWLDNLVTSER